MSSRILVLGCSGAVGSRLIAFLAHREYEIMGIRLKGKCSSQKHRCVSIDLLDYSAAIDFSDFRPEYLIHTAWITKPVEFWESELNKSWLDASKRIIKLFFHSGGKYLAVTGTCAEYDWALKRLLREDDLANPISLYGRSKLELLNWLNDLGIPFLWTRTFAQFDENEPTERLIPTVIDSLLRGRPVIINNSEGVRDFIYTEDVANILGRLIMGNQTGVVNIGTGSGVKIGDVALRIGSIIGRTELINISEIITAGDMVVANTIKLKQILGEYSWIDFDEALHRSIEARIARFNLSKSK